MSEISELLKKAFELTTNEELKIAINSAIELESLQEKIQGNTKIRAKLLEMVKSPNWPKAIDEEMICQDNEDDKIERAEGIIDYIELPLKDKKFLDFGCGEGHVVLKSSEQSSKSVGYEIESKGNLVWESEEEKYLLTTNFEKVLSHAPYDIILLYDVLDHAKNPIECLNMVKKACDQNTKVFVRCHTFMSRHGTHIYKTLNKAWAHLYLNDDELEMLNAKGEFTNKVYFPLIQQDGWFKSAGFKKIFEKAITGKVEEYFKNPYLLKCQPKAFNSNEAPIWQMSQTFNDYLIKIN